MGASYGVLVGKKEVDGGTKGLALEVVPVEADGIGDDASVGSLADTGSQLVPRGASALAAISEEDGGGSLAGNTGPESPSLFPGLAEDEQSVGSAVTSAASSAASASASAAPSTPAASTLRRASFLPPPRARSKAPPPAKKTIYDALPEDATGEDFVWAMRKAGSAPWALARPPDESEHVGEKQSLTTTSAGPGSSAAGSSSNNRRFYGSSKHYQYMSHWSREHKVCVYVCARAANWKKTVFWGLSSVVGSARRPSSIAFPSLVNSLSIRRFSLFCFGGGGGCRRGR